MLNDQARPLDSLQRLRAGISMIRGVAEAEGRDPETIAIAVRVVAHGDPIMQAGDGERRLFSGAAADVAADLSSLRQLGVIAVDFRFAQRAPDDALTAMEAFQRDVVARI
jgi:hypothetical protein